MPKSDGRRRRRKTVIRRTPTRAATKRTAASRAGRPAISQGRRVAKRSPKPDVVRLATTIIEEHKELLRRLAAR